MTERKQTNDQQATNIETSAQHGHNPVASSKIDRTIVDAQDLGPENDRDPNELQEYGDDETVTDRVNTNLGRLIEAEHLARLNINTQQDGVVYLRGPVRSQEESNQVEQITRETEGVKQVVNELNIIPDFKVS